MTGLDWRLSMLRIMVFIFVCVRSVDLSKKVWTVYNVNTRPDCRSTCEKYGTKCGIKETTPRLKFHCKQCAVQAKSDDLSDEDNLDEIIQKEWTISTYNRHPRCRETCHQHKLYCVRISHDPARFGCDTKERKYHRKHQQKIIHKHLKQKHKQNGNFCKLKQNFQ